jgi:hypothetical protein
MNRAARFATLLALIALNGAMATPMFSSTTGRTTIEPIVLNDGGPMPTAPPSCHWGPNHSIICPK